MVMRFWHRPHRVGARPTRVMGVVVLMTATILSAAPARPAPPASLTDAAFWRLSADSSEPGGYFRSQDITNLTSNEMQMQVVIQDLVARTRPGGVYLGVGPEQNFTYIAAIRPAMAIIFDIRRGNLDLQLMYKAIFELSKDRADFVAMLFAKPRPAGLTSASTADQLFAAFGQAASSEALYRANLQAIETDLATTHGFALAASDRQGLETVYQTFYWSGFAVRPSPTYAELMLQRDGSGVERSFLSSEERYLVLRDLEQRNLVVPVVGNFEGPKAIRAVGAYLHAAGATVAAFYLSNVEQYLASWDTFCRNVATLPLDPHSTFIRSAQGGGYRPGGGFVSSLGSMADEVSGCR
jgi:hypothetical protein